MAQRVVGEGFYSRGLQQRVCQGFARGVPPGMTLSRYGLIAGPINPPLLAVIANCFFTGKRNYRQFFTLMVFALILLILQCSTGILVMFCCFIERKRFSLDIASKLGSSFTVVPFASVVAVCTILAMIATMPIAQLFFFHILLIKKGISTYDYIIALREQEQQGTGGQQSPQMSPASSLTGLSSASSVNTFHRGAWCTPPRLFLEDQFDVVPPDTGSVCSLGKKKVTEEPIKKKNPAAVRISPWALARLNTEEVTKLASEARKRSKILQPVGRRRETPFGLEAESSFGCSSQRMISNPDINTRRQTSKRVLVHETQVSAKAEEDDNGNGLVHEASTCLAPLQLEALIAFQTSQAMSNSAAIAASSPDSSLDSPAVLSAAQKRITLSGSTSDGYEASGGEDSDRVPSRTVQRSKDWITLPFNSERDERIARLKGSNIL
ncbi:hypothetical protein U1Q18_029462 [Sarracenia purpurea var. burkii]